MKKPPLSCAIKKNIFLPEYDKREMIKQFLKLGCDEIEKKKFHYSKNPVAIGNVDVNIIITFDVSAYDKNKKTDAKFFIGYKDDKKVSPLWIKLPKIVAMSIVSNKINTYLFRSKIMNCKKNLGIWDKASSITETTFDTQPVFEENI